MDLPNYFIADLPPEASVGPDLIREACQTLRRNRERFLLPRPTEAIIEAVVELARLWTAPYSPWRARALEYGPASAGVSREMLGAGLDAFFRQVTARNLAALVVQDLGHSQRLDRLVANDSETFMNAQASATGPGLMVQLADGPLPLPVFTGLIHGLLARSAQFVGCPPGASVLPRIFAHSLRDVDPKLASCLELAAFPGPSTPLAEALLGEADCVVAAGSEAELTSIRSAVPMRVRFLPRPRRYAAAYIAREVLGPQDEERVLASAASEATVWDQLGELAPQVFFVESGGVLPPEHFARRLSEVLERREAEFPSGRRPVEVEQELERRRAMYRVRASSGDGSRCWFPEGCPGWGVVYDPEPVFQVGGGRGLVLVRAVDDLEECLRRAEPFRGQWTSLGLAASGLRYGELAQRFAAWGLTRVCPLGRLQPAPWTWRRDGRPVLGELVTWCSVERAD